MNKQVDDFFQEIEEQIIGETISAYGELAYQRWMNPLYRGALENPDACGLLTGQCGDRMEIFLKFEQERVKEAAFETDGCGLSVVCGSLVAEMAIGKEPDELLQISGEAILEFLGRFPEEERHWAFLASDALQQALQNYLGKRSQKRT